MAAEYNCILPESVLNSNLKPFGILEFARSGRVAVTKPMKELSTYLKELETKN